jgi:general secretion pathway protein N
MKWLQGNPVGMALAALSGLFLLLSLGMAIVWTLPVAVDVADTGSDITSSDDSILAAGQIGALGDYQVINERPVFNESRLPVIEEDDAVLDEVVDDPSIAVKDAPDVRLTGVIITPGMKIASLTPADGDLESVMAHEGESLIGEYVGWKVSAVNPRNVVLESRDGRRLELELLVHDVKIKEPPKPVPAEKTAKNESGKSAAGMDEDDEPLSRAEQIRQRIAERREELRREQEEQGNGEAGQPRPANGRSAYQNAIRTQMRPKSKDTASNEKENE